MMVGLPGSGKSYTAKNVIIPSMTDGNVAYLSSDEYREKLLGDVNNQNNNALIFSTLQKDALEALSSGKDVIYDATNVTLKNRANILKAINEAKIQCKKIAYVVAPPIEICIAQDEKRERTVGKDVIDKFHRSFQMPQKFEGFNKIIINGYDTYNLHPFLQGKTFELLSKMEDFNQMNPHHKFTLYSHCLRLSFQYSSTTNNNLGPSVGEVAGILHDVGKLFTQVIDENGVAHYYNHDSVGTYYLASHLEVLYCRSWDDILKVLFLVNYHMRAHRDIAPGTKAEIKYRRIFGDEWYDDLMQFAEFDKIASGTYHKED